MWPSNKKERKEIKLSPGESMEIGFATSWRIDKDEVVIITDSGQIVLDGKNELFIEVTAENIDPVKLQLIPDFKNKTINLIEIIDPNIPNIKKKFDGPRLKFAGSIIKERTLTISDYLKNWDQDIEHYGKLVNRSKKVRNILIPVYIILFFWNSYIFITTINIFRYASLSIAIACLYMPYYTWNSHKKFYEAYLEYKDLREKTFGVVKEK